MNGTETPQSPLHPGPNDEIDPNSLPTTKLQDDDLELNPELYDEDEEDEQKLDEEDSKIAQSYLPNYEDDELDNVELDSLTEMTLPFEEKFQQFIAKNFKNSTNQVSLSLTQQSKFINYIDEQLLDLQRQFIKQQSESIVVFPLSHLIRNLNEIIDLIWKSICYNNQVNLFGQEEYYIKIIGDFQDYLLYYPNLFYQSIDIDEQGKRWTNLQKDEVISFFKFLLKLDLQLSFLLSNDKDEDVIPDYIKVNGKSKFSNTEIIRLSPIITRIRIIIIEKIEKLSKEIKSKTMKNLMELESSRIFEGILERI
ncbi:hypothetical protein KGF54_003315 [Candida jiufengensis]|uniref:uncharacterized protein n=1 Tax=Candida jiufengensis TaxID=497108 RepID=UPI00222473FE|nr:uncharacterized protein KGF54_003315 [Candida jiufengensis]KAI5952448.1 hypothetical protein KGF54_003315 [Candida jiufengensis]